jgi:predicted dinucleotide-binding enzyme
MTRIGLIGAGNIGGALARHFAAVGHDVAVSNSRDPQTLAGLVAELGDRARAGTPAEAANFGEIVVVSVPLGRYRDVPVDGTAGKVVIDTNNYYPSRDGQIAELDHDSATSSGLLAEHLPDAKVVKAFNQIGAANLAADGKPAGDPARTAIPIAGDDAGAKAVVARLIESIGFDTVDVGGLDASRIFQPGGPLYQQSTAAQARNIIAANA